MATPNVPVDSNKVIQAMQERFSKQVANYETTIAMYEVVIQDLQDKITMMENPGIVPIEGVEIETV